MLNVSFLYFNDFCIFFSLIKPIFPLLTYKMEGCKSKFSARELLAVIHLLNAHIFCPREGFHAHVRRPRYHFVLEIRYTCASTCLLFLEILCMSPLLVSLCAEILSSRENKRTFHILMDVAWRYVAQQMTVFIFFQAIKYVIRIFNFTDGLVGLIYSLSNASHLIA